MGSSDFSSTILKKLATCFSIQGVITQPDKPAGRGKKLTPPPAKLTAISLGIEVFQPERLRTPEAFEVLTNWKPDLIIVAAYGQILRQNVLDLPGFGCINVHASYLPRWRGASPIQTAILNGDESTGVTIMKMDAGIDTGPELAKTKVLIHEKEDYYTLSRKLADTGADLLVNTLPEYLAGNLVPREQPQEGATYASLIKKEDGILDFQQPAVILERQIRALIDWPVCQMTYDGQSLKIRKAEVDGSSHLPAGQKIIIGKYPCIGTSDGILILKEVQPAGKNWMDGRDFLRGARNWIQ
jgi:methionyl-tRNA formyltransferase